MTSIHIMLLIRDHKMHLLSDFSSTDVEKSDVYGDVEGPEGRGRAKSDLYGRNVDWFWAFPRIVDDNEGDIPSKYEDSDDMQSDKGSDCDEVL